jgi:glutaredoxin
MESFTGLNAQVLGISVDHIPCLQAWAESVGGIHYPLLSDFWPHGVVSNIYGVLRSSDGFSERAIFVLDKEGILRYIDIHDIADRPDNDVLRGVLRKIEDGELQAVKADAPGMGTPAMAPPADDPVGTGVYFGEADDDEPPSTGVTLYCARWCKDCRKVKAWLDEHEIKYVEVDIDRDVAARSQVRKWANGYLVTPVIDFDGEIILDFNLQKLENAYNRRAQAQA